MTKKTTRKLPHTDSIISASILAIEIGRTISSLPYDVGGELSEPLSKEAKELALDMLEMASKVEALVGKIEEARS